jgi:2-succinyl-6-hydroxy-2,4-cyclohexadiene-1-carboxylate synthase
VIVSVDGFGYGVERSGAGSPVVVLHGFTGSIAAMRATIDALARRHTVVAIDLPGHGASIGAAPERYAMDRVAADLAHIAERLAVAPATWLGYSLGGRTALCVAAAHPRVVDALVLVGASPGIADAAERAARVRSDAELAASIERDGIAAFVERWERLPLFATQAALAPGARAAIRAQRLTNVPRELAHNLAGMGTGAQRPLHDVLPAIDVPVLLVAGAADAKFSAIADAMASRLPRARVARIAGAGHAAHLESPAAFDAAVETFIATRHTAASLPEGRT